VYRQLVRVIFGVGFVEAGAAHFANLDFKRAQGFAQWLVVQLGFAQRQQKLSCEALKFVQIFLADGVEIHCTAHLLTITIRDEGLL
jgi:hypothetical protein